ncbi:alpha-amylase family glycosyl hydrolase [Chloroflexus sp.]|uniref:alpha-amylase family glycosyl hydrolase n=1 Tax=Chloroflexus sp. TaxID=1904827 RepID=UPI002ACE06B3|nr:alpha-amylase family glycosyl hydrolase [Chloroflexus sp.]
MRPRSFLRLTHLILALGLLIGIAGVPALPVAQASHSPLPASVNLAGNLQSEATANACGDWDPSCPASAFSHQGNGVYLFVSAPIPPGSYEYKIAMGSWAENYGANFQLNGPNIPVTLNSAQSVRFYYDHKTHYIADSARNTIYTVPGNFNSEIGCSGDWQPECLRTFMSDVDGDGIFTFTTDAIPPGNYEFKIATNESWSNPNYGAFGNNVPFTVAGPATVTFSFNTATTYVGVEVRSALPQPDNNVEWDGVYHNSRDPLYRTPGGAVPAGTPVTIRLRTFHNDVTAVTLRVYDVNGGAQRFVPMSVVAADTDCYGDYGPRTCDFWAATLVESSPNNLWYRFIVTDGTDTDYYADNTAALDGGSGRMTDDVVDFSYALMFYDPAFTSPNWAKSAVIYQIFPDRFRNGNPRNDPKDGDIRYDDPVIKLGWGELPEGFCRHYADAATNCPWRFDTTPPAWSPAIEGPRGRDYYGGDLQGVIEQLDYLKRLGITTIYFNPIFAAGSNHRYDTRDYYRIDPYLGNNGTFTHLVQEARRRGIRIVLDNVFNHMSSDSPFFDRYSHYPTLGACESLASPYRNWFNFRTTNVPCTSADYVGWFGFDSIPEINKSNPAVQEYFLTGSNSVARFWLRRGAAGWRLDVMGDASFPAGYWETFRSVVRQTKSDALIVGELWQKDSTLLRHLRGQTADTAMNYRLRDAVIGLLLPGGTFDSKGFGDSGRVISPSEFLSRLASIREDYPDAAYYTLMNLLGSHDTERILWTLTPGQETRADKELNAASVAEGKRRVQLASLIQFTMPGAPTIYYGDEVGVTGDDDPDDRRTYPWPDLGGSPDTTLFNHYAELAELRNRYPSLVKGDFTPLLAGDAAGVVAYGRKYRNEAAIVLINRSASAQTVTVPVSGFLPNGVELCALFTVGNQRDVTVRVVNGNVQITLAPLSGTVLITEPGADLTPPAAPRNLRVTNEGDGAVSLSWQRPSGGPQAYNVYRSPVSGGGWVKVNATPVTGLSFTDTTVRNGRTYYYVVRALDAVGNEGPASAEVSALPHYRIGWANLQWPPSIDHTISAITFTPDIYGQVWINGVTNQPGATPGLRAQVGYGPQGSDPRGAGWVWVEASFNVDAGNNDEFRARLQPETVGTFNYVFRYSTTGGRDWIYADRSGPFSGLPAQPGVLNVLTSGDRTPPATPTGLQVLSASPAGIALSWNAVGDAYAYEVRRTDSSGNVIIFARTTATTFTDTAVAQGATYSYAVRALDESFNRSDFSAPVTATAELRTVTLVMNVTVPAPVAAAVGRSVYIAGFLDRLDGGLPQWNPGGVVMTQVGPTQWTITFTGREGTQLEYKYTLGSWDYVEKGAACEELANRQLTLTYGTSGVQTVNDTVLNWRNVTPCGN